MTNDNQLYGNPFEGEVVVRLKNMNSGSKVVQKHVTVVKTETLISLSWSDVITFGGLLLSFQHNFLHPVSWMTSPLEDGSRRFLLNITVHLPTHTSHPRISDVRSRNLTQGFNLSKILSYLAGSSRQIIRQNDLTELLTVILVYALHIL